MLEILPKILFPDSHFSPIILSDDTYYSQRFSFKYNYNTRNTRATTNFILNYTVTLEK